MENVKDKSWIQQKMMEWFMPVIAWYMKDHWKRGFAHDVQKQDIQD